MAIIFSKSKLHYNQRLKHDILPVIVLIRLARHCPTGAVDRRDWPCLNSIYRLFVRALEISLCTVERSSRECKKGLQHERVDNPCWLVFSWINYVGWTIR